MPREWHDPHALSQIGDDNTREFYRSIIADKKPYFMRLIYPDLMKEYNKYINNTKRHAIRQFRLTVEDLKKIPPEELTEDQVKFLEHYDRMMPVGVGDCVMNIICRRFEDEFNGYIRKQGDYGFDHSILKSGVEYSKSQYKSIEKIYAAYNKKIKDFAAFVEAEKVDKDTAFSEVEKYKDEFLRDCIKICQDRFVLCDIALDICYSKSGSKRFVWDMCGEEIIENLLRKNNNVVSFPSEDPNGNIYYAGKRFTLKEATIERGDDFEFSIE